MASILKVDTLQDQDGNNIISESANVITIGASGDTITIPSGASMSGFNSTGIDDNATSTAITIDSSENVGIGTSSPSYTLDVVGNMRLTSDIRLDNGTDDSPQVVLVSSGYSDWYWDNAQGSLRAINGSTERMRIDSSGNVGIGNTVASTINSANGTGNLVVGSGSGTEGITIYSGTTGEGTLQFADASTGAGTYVGQINYNHSNNFMSFGANGSERMRIDSSGNVGIGTSSPTCKLDVTETIQIDNTVTIGGSQFTGDFDIQINNLYTLNGNSHRRYGLRLSYAGVGGDATNAQQKDTLIYINGLTSWSGATPVDTGGGTIAVTVTSSSSNSTNIRVTTPASNTVGAYVATLFANSEATMICYG